MEDTLKSCLKAVNTSHQAIRDIDKNAAVWAAYYSFNSASKAVNYPFDTVKKLYAKLNFTGKKYTDLSIEGRIFCKNNKGAADLATLLNGLVMLLLPEGFQSNPELAGKLAQRVKMQPAGSIIKVELSIPEKLLDALLNYYQKQAEKT